MLRSVQLDGDTGFAEIFFDDVRVPVENTLGEVNKGWNVAMTTLTYERGAAEGAGSGGGMSMDDRIRALVDLAKRTRRPGGKTAWDDAVVRDKVMQLAVRAEGFRQGSRRARVAGDRDSATLRNDRDH